MEFKALAETQVLGYGCYACLFRYRPDAATCRLAWSYEDLFQVKKQAPIGYYARLGHGTLSCPEIYSRTSGKLGVLSQFRIATWSLLDDVSSYGVAWMLCGGGSAVEQHIVARPIVLMTSPVANQRDDFLMIVGEGPTSCFTDSRYMLKELLAATNAHVICVLPLRTQT